MKRQALVPAPAASPFGVNCSADNDDCFDPNKNPALKREIRAAKKDQVPENYVKRVIQFAQQGYKDIEFKTYDTD